MNFFVTCQDDSSAEHTLRLRGKLGEGKFSVYHVYSASHRTSYALKIFPKTSFGVKQYRKELLLSSFSHPNIIKYIPLKCISTEFYGLITEYAKYGDFFSLVTFRPIKNEILLRTYFQQLIEGLEYLHSEGVAHLDLKLENIVFGSDLTLKIIDFDQAQPITDNHIISAGTPNYRAPEIIEEKCDNLQAADVYSAGIILFAMKSGQMPFMERIKEEGINLYLYSRFVKNNKKFWADKDACLEGEEHFDADFIELVNGMLEYNVEKRLTIKQIKESKWFKGPVLSKESLNSEMEKIFKNMMQTKMTEINENH